MSINKQLTKEIKLMRDVDQDIRSQCFNNPEFLKPLSEMFCNKPKTKKEKYPLNASFTNILLYLTEGYHNYKIRRIIEEYGYPTKKLLGAKRMNDFWLLVQHQDMDSKLQEDCLKNCDFDKKDKAYLTDRVLLKQDKKQIYGTQFQRDKKTGKMKLQPVENIKEADKKRKEVGIKTTIKKDLKKINKRMKH